MFGKRNKSKETVTEYNLSEREEYTKIVENYINFSGWGIISCLASLCEKNNGRLTYFQMEMVLGKHYPKASWVDKSDRKGCVETFLEHSGFMYYKADEDYIYFP